MYRIEIGYNKNDELVLAQYDEDDKLMGRCKGKDVKRLLSTIEDEEIKKIFPSGRDTAVVVYDDAYINVHQIERMDNEPLMQNYLKILEKHLDQKEARESKVTRVNKYRGMVIAIATLLFIAVVGTMMAGAALAPEAVDAGQVTTPPGVHQTGEMPSQTITSTPIFGTSTEEETPPPKPEIEEDYMFLEYEDRSDSEKLKTTEALYGDIIEKYANMYGLDPQLVLALATQERGIHSDKMDAGGATGLMQIQNGIWEGSELTAYNFATEKYETITVTKKMIQSLEGNIDIGCRILQSYIRGKNYNIALGVASYNMGPTNISKVLNECSYETGIPKEAIVGDQTNNSWLPYRSIIKVGDKKYNEHVFSYMGEEFTTYVLKPNGEKVELTVKNHTQTKVANR